jgi:hypothetical protein
MWDTFARAAFTCAGHGVGEFSFAPTLTELPSTNFLAQPVLLYSQHIIYLVYVNICYLSPPRQYKLGESEGLGGLCLLHLVTESPALST